jgi:hypothetical protein
MVRIFLLEVRVRFLHSFGRALAGAFGLIDQIPRQQRGMIFDLGDELGRGERNGLHAVLMQEVELVGAEAVADHRVEAVFVQVGHHGDVELVEVDADGEEALAVDGHDAVGVKGDFGRGGGGRRRRDDASGCEPQHSQGGSDHHSVSLVPQNPPNVAMRDASVPAGWLLC